MHLEIERRQLKSSETSRRDLTNAVRSAISPRVVSRIRTRHARREAVARGDGMVVVHTGDPSREEAGHGADTEGVVEVMKSEATHEAAAATNARVVNLGFGHRSHSVVRKIAVPVRLNRLRVTRRASLGQGGCCCLARRALPAETARMGCATVVRRLQVGSRGSDDAAAGDHDGREVGAVGVDQRDRKGRRDQTAVGRGGADDGAEDRSADLGRIGGEEARDEARGEARGEGHGDRSDGGVAHGGDEAHAHRRRP